MFEGGFTVTSATELGVWQCSNIYAVDIYGNAAALSNYNFVFSGANFTVNDPKAYGNKDVVAPSEEDTIVAVSFAGQTENQEITVVQNDYLYTVSDGEATITDYIGPGGDITIPAEISDGVNVYPISSIGYSAFSGWIGLTSVTIPNSVTSIEGRAFAFCSNLTNVTIPDSVTSIGDRAFSYCINLTSVTIPDSVISIGALAFGYCRNLISLTIGSSVTSIGDNAFNNCSSLNNIIANPLIAPETISTAFAYVPQMAVALHIQAGALGYDVAPWAQFNIIDNVVTGIAITMPPIKTAYVEGQSFEMAGMVVTASYANGKTADVSKEVSVSTGALLTTDTDVTISYEGKTANQAITVAEKNLITVNLVPGGTLSSSVNFNRILYVTDNQTDNTVNYANGPSGLQWVQMDLSAAYDLNAIQLWHYYGDGRSYQDVVVQLSNDETFTDGVVTVFNNDKDGSAGLGVGTNYEYSETSAGKAIKFDTVNARYVRFYSNGSNVNGRNHYVEIEVYGSEAQGPLIEQPATTNVASGATLSTSANFTRTVYVTDSQAATTSNYANGP